MGLPADTAVTIVPVRRYRNCAAAIEWLCRAFGLRRQAVYAGGGSGHASGDPDVHLSSSGYCDPRKIEGAAP